MSLRAPFLVKQYLSEDVESGSYSRIFWYHPLDADKSPQGGVGLFFEVLSGDVDDDVYEQITKRFWTSFTENFYTEGFEESLKKSIKSFIHLLQSFGIEEGLDVNIVLFNVVEEKAFYTLKLISFGDSDIFVVRDGKFADMSNMVPENQTLYDLKFLEVELDKGDVLMLGNKTLLRNAFEADIFVMDNVEALLMSLEEFKENLFGSKKVLLVAANDGSLQDQQSENKNKSVEILNKGKAFLLNALGTIKSFLPNKEKLKEDEKSSALEDNDIIFEGTEDKSDIKVENLKNSDMPRISSSSVISMPKKEDSGENNDLFGESVLDEEEILAKEEKKNDQKIEIMSSSPEEFKQKADEESYIIDAPETLPGRNVSVDDFVITEDVTTDMTVEKSEYKEIVDDAIEEETREEERIVKKSDIYGGQQFSAQKGRAANYVQEFKAMRSPLAKLTRSPSYKKAMDLFSDIWEKLKDKVLVILKRKPDSTEKKKPPINPSKIEARKIQPGIIIIIFIVLIVAVFNISRNNKQKKLEQTLLTEMKEVIGEFNSFYEQDIAIIDNEDLNHQLEMCGPNSKTVFEKEDEILPQMKNEEVISEVKLLSDQVKTKVAECEAKYDRIYGIVRVKDAELITDFKTSLGSDSDVTSLDLYKGYLVVTDSGRNAVYQMNIETRNFSIFEDPLNLVTKPVTLGTGEKILFVCDETNGVLYYSSNATASGGEGFVRIPGAEPSSIGDCITIDGFRSNAYVIPSTANVVYKLQETSDGVYAAPQRYISNIKGARTLSIDGSIYISSTVGEVGNITKFYGGNKDSFAMPQTVQLGELVTSYTNPSNDRNLYVYDKTANAIYSIEKPDYNRHAGRGIIEKTYLLQNDSKFSDIKGIAVDVNGNNQETYIYILAGSTIWRVQL